MIDGRVIAFLAGAVIALVLGGYGLYKVAYAQGYVCGRESVRNGFTPEDKE